MKLIILLLMCFLLLGCKKASQVDSASTTVEENQKLNEEAEAPFIPVEQKECATHEDCVLHPCNGCMSHSALKDAPVADASCTRFEGHLCLCQDNICEAIPNI